MELRDILLVITSIARNLDIVYHIGWTIPALLFHRLAGRMLKSAGGSEDNSIRLVLRSLRGIAVAFILEQVLWLALYFAGISTDVTSRTIVLVAVWFIIRLSQTTLLFFATRAFWAVFGDDTRPLVMETWSDFLNSFIDNPRRIWRNILGMALKKPQEKGEGE